MKRKMIGVTAGYLSGLFFASFFTDLRHLLIPAGIFLVFVLVGKQKGLSANDFAIVAVSFALSFMSGEIYTHFVYNNIVSYDGTEGNFSGVVEDYDCYDKDKARYILKGKINGECKAKVSFYSDNLDVHYGDTVNIGSCTFKKMSGDYLFDSESYYKSDRIFLTAENADNIVTENNNFRKIRNFLMNHRENIISDFRIVLGDDCGGFLAGMVFGEKSTLDGSVKTSLYRMGTGHVMAVSGLHISVMAMFVMLILNFLKVNKFLSFGFVNIFMAFMVTMANYPVSAIRALIMVDIAFSAKLFLRENDTFNSLAIAVLLICLENPYVIYSSGFLLSVSGTFGIGVFAPYMVKKLPDVTAYDRIIRLFITMLCTSIAVLPVSMIYFDEISLISPIANIFVVPMCSFCMVLGMIYTVTGFTPVLWSAGGIIKIILFVAEKVSELKFTYISCGNDVAVKIALICAVVVVMVKVATENRKYTAVSIALSVFVTACGSALYNNMNRDIFTVAVLGKGSNASVVVSYKSRNYVVDLNGHYKNPQYVGKYLSENGIRSVDCIFLADDIYSLYSSYYSELESTDIEKWFITGNAVPCKDGNFTFFDENGCQIENSDYTIRYDGETLEIIFGESEMCFVSAKDSVPENNGLTVFYGNIPKNSEMICDGKSIYLDEKEAVSYQYAGMNNFKTEMSADGTYKIIEMK
ncbi:MAG: ComEC/Rec2 family competence protein [Ruminococcus sp.]|nr:ComEC/Rec2 family competence protein [Ruminococcus sp.]